MHVKTDLVGNFRRMRRATLPAMLAIVLIFGLPACSAGASGSASIAPDAALAMGTLRLEGTAQAIDAEEAAELLPLWQLMKELKSSSSTAQAEVDAVVEKIQATMTAAQSKAIETMEFTEAEGTAVEVSTGSSSGSGGTSRSQSAGPEMMASGPPAGGMPMEAAFAGAASSSTSGRGSATIGSQAAGTTSSTVLVEQVIKLLQGKFGNSE